MTEMPKEIAMPGAATPGNERRNRIIQMLTASDTPVSGQTLGLALNVSRQVIVQDVALLRTAGFAISSTPRGYVLGGETQAIRRVKVKHGTDRIEEEMNAIVDLGGCIIDVMVNHHTYGMISAPLDVKSRRDVKRFLTDLAQGVSQPLSSLTEGYHFHHISAESEEILDEIQNQLDDLGLSAPLTEYERATL